MADAIKLSCGGKQPWLPHPAIKDRNAQNSAPCSERLTLLVRTASNSYFHVVVSALSVPDPANTIRDALSPSADRIRERYADGEGPVKDLLKYDYKGLVKEHGIENVLAAAVALATGAPAQRHPIRTGEYVQFTNAPPPTTGERFEERERFVARALPADAPALRSSVGTKLERIVLAHRLREVRVQVGFTRISPAGSDNQGEYDENVQLAPLSREADWLPASTVQGEGLFLQLSSSALREWENRPEVIARAKVLSDAYTTWHLSNTNANSRGPDATMPPFVGARFYLLHSLSHLLINSIAMECGYSASAIRERIYCGPYGDDPTDMAGILLYTGTVGSEGTLGGLVDQGNQLHIHLERAIESASLCSNDPVCAAHNPADDPAERFLEGAACHGCLFVSESSCERFNRYLDRSLVIPVIGGDMRTAFFDDIVLI
jgi:hypothetical protein